MHEVLIKTIRAPETTSQFEALGAFAIGNSPAEFGAYIRREYESNGRIVKTAGLKID